MSQNRKTQDIRTIEIVSNSNNLAQAFTYGYLFGLVNQEDKIVSGLIFCKDYMTDQIFADKYKKNIKVYGYDAIPQNNTEYKLAIFSDNAKYPLAEIDKFTKFIHREENVIGFNNSITRRVKTKKGSKLIEGILIEPDQRWFEHPILISFYTYMLRTAQILCMEIPEKMLMDHKIEPTCLANLPGAYQLKSPRMHKNYKEAIVNKNWNKFKGFTEDMDEYTLHNLCGILDNNIE